MRFFAEHRFSSTTLAQFEHLFFDEPFNDSLCQAVAIERHVQSHTMDDGTLIRRAMIFPQRQVPGPIAKLTGTAKIGYCEHLTYRLGSYAATFSCESTVMPERVSTQGTIHLIQDGKEVIRRVEGEVRVKVFGVGSMIERFIVNDVEQGYADAARFTQRFIDERTHT